MRYIILRVIVSIYLNIGIKAEYEGGEPIVVEPDKCTKWQWFSLNNLPDNLFESTSLMIKNFKAGKIY